MHHALPLPRLLFIGLGALAAAGCGVGDIFASAGIGDVVIQYQGDTAISRDTTVPFSVVVLVDGALAGPQHLEIHSSDTSVFDVTPAGDSIHTKSRIFHADLVVRVLSSVLTDTAPTLRQRISVKP